MNGERNDLDVHLHAGLDNAVQAVDWPRLEGRLQRRLEAIQPRRLCAGDVLGVAARLAAAAVLLAVAVWLGVAWLGDGARQRLPARGAPARQGRPAVEVRALSPRSVDLQDVLAQLPGGVMDESWIDRRLR